MKLWDLATGKELHTIQAHTGEVLCVAISKEGMLASASNDSTVKLWDLSSGRELHTFKGHMGRVWSVTFSPDGMRLASASADKTVKLWDVASRQELRTLRAHTDTVNGVAFSPDGKRLASADETGMVKLWDARPFTENVKAEVEAIALLDRLRAKPLTKSATKAAVHKHPILSEAARQKALELAEFLAEETDSKKYHAAAWPIIRHPYANVFMAQNALSQMQAACVYAPNEGQYRIGLGIVHYRLGKFHKEHYTHGLTQLAKCDQGQPTTLAFLAMTHHQLGHKAEAQANLALLQNLMKGERWAKDQQSLAFQAETEATMQAAAKLR